MIFKIVVVPKLVRFYIFKFPVQIFRKKSALILPQFRFIAIYGTVSAIYCTDSAIYGSYKGGVAKLVHFHYFEGEGVIYVTPTLGGRYKMKYGKIYIYIYIDITE